MSNQRPFMRPRLSFLTSAGRQCKSARWAALPAAARRSPGRTPRTCRTRRWRTWSARNPLRPAAIRAGSARLRFVSAQTPRSHRPPGVCCNRRAPSRRLARSAPGLSASGLVLPATFVSEVRSSSPSVLNVRDVYILAFAEWSVKVAASASALLFRLGIFNGRPGRSHGEQDFAFVKSQAACGCIVRRGIGAHQLAREGFVLNVVPEFGKHLVQFAVAAPRCEHQVFNAKACAFAQVIVLPHQFACNAFTLEGFTERGRECDDVCRIVRQRPSRLGCELDLNLFRHV